MPKTEVKLTKDEIKAITDKAKSPCLIGIRAFDEDVQQFTCRSFNGKYCTCYKDYCGALDAHLIAIENPSK